MNRFPFFSALRSRHQKLPGSEAEQSAFNTKKRFQPTLALVRAASERSVTSHSASSVSDAALLSRMVTTPARSSYEVTPPRRSLRKDNSSTSLSFRRASSSYTLSTDPDLSFSSTLSDADVALVDAKGTLLLVPTSLTVNTYEVTPPKRFHVASSRSHPSQADLPSSCTVHVPHAERHHSMLTGPRAPSSFSKLRIARAMGRRPSGKASHSTEDAPESDGEDNDNDETMKYPYCVLSGPRPMGSSQNWWARKRRRQRIQEILNEYKAEIQQRSESNIEQSIQRLLNANAEEGKDGFSNSVNEDSSCVFSLEETDLFLSADRSGFEQGYAATH